MATKRILVVEDEPMLAKGVQIMLKRFGYDVVGPVVTGEEAVRYAKEHAPDLAMMDITLSGSMDGIEAAEKIRSIRDIPVIYLTASSDRSTLDRAKVTEPYGYLLKPFSDRELFVTVETALYKAAMEARLKDSEQRYRDLFEHCPIALFEVDFSETKRHLTRLQEAGIENIGDYLAGNMEELLRCIHTCRVIGLNQAALFMFEASDPGEFERNLTKFFDADRPDGARAYLESIAQGAPYFRGAGDLKTLSGKNISVEWTSSVLQGHEQPFSRVSLCIQDVTATKRAREELEKAHQELEIRVEERTSDLRRVVTRLHEEMASREEIGKNLQQRVDELDAINRVSQSMSSSLLPSQVLKFAHDEIYAALEPDGVEVYVYRENALELKHIESMHGPFVPNTLYEKEMGQCLCGLALNERRSQYCLDTQAEPRCTMPQCRHSSFRSLVTLPLQVGEHVLGVIALGSSRLRDFSEHAAFLETVASHLAVALQNAQLHQQVEEARARLEQRVVERTRELAQTNENLQNEIKERKLVEEALRQSEAKFRGIFHNAAIGISLVDRDARFIERNAAMCRILGYESEELDGRSAFDFTHPHDLEASVANHNALVRGDYSWYRFEKRYVRKDGEIVWADLSASVIRDQAREYVATVAVVTDITDRKRYEHSQAQLIDEIRDFAYIVSHDLRSPLANLKGFSRELNSALEIVRPAIELAIPDMPESDRLKVVEALETDIPECLSFMGASIAHMNNQVNGILQLARLGRSELCFELLSMNSLVEQILTTFAYDMNQRGIKVSLGDLPDIIADRTAIDQIMANLIGNAVKYLQSGRPGHITISAEPLLTETRFAVRDNGRGIREEDLAKIFDIFQRSGKADVPGEGLGLSFVRTLVRRHGGRVWCESTPGKGSAFYFTIAQDLKPQDSC